MNKINQPLNLAQICQNTALCPEPEMRYVRGTLIEAANELRILDGVAREQARELNELRAKLKQYRYLVGPVMAPIGPIGFGVNPYNG